MYLRNNSAAGAYVAGVIIGCGVILIIAALIAENEHPTVCKHEETVTQILEVNYRSARFLLSDGTERILNQSSLKPGDKFCTYWSRS